MSTYSNQAEAYADAIVRAFSEKVSSEKARQEAGGASLSYVRPGQEDDAYNSPTMSRTPVSNDFAAAAQSGQLGGVTQPMQPLAAAQLAATQSLASGQALREQKPLDRDASVAASGAAREALSTLGQKAATDVATGGAGADVAASQRQQIDFLQALQAAGGPGRAAAAQQAQLAAALMRRATGEEAGAGQLQLARALEASQAQTASQIAGLRGLSPAAAQRLLVQQQAAQSQTAAGQSAMIAAQEQEAAQKQLAGLLETTRNQDISTQANVANQLANQLVQTRTGDIEGEDRAKRTAAAIFEGIRTGDQNMVNAAITEANARRAAEVQLIGQQLNFIDSQGRIDAERARIAIDAEIRKADLALQQGKLTAAEAQREKDYWNNIWGTVIRGAVGATVGLVLGGPTGSVMGAGLALGTPADKIPAAGKARGGRIDGDVRVPGDHPDNDVVPAMLSPGEIVLPRSIAQAEDAPEKAAAFVHALQKAEAQPMSRRAAARRIEQLETEIAALRAARGDGR